MRATVFIKQKASSGIVKAERRKHNDNNSTSKRSTAKRKSQFKFETEKSIRNG